jgi:bifunctional DNA-binding transcriptional regulator/antitoxin component of YhaV-PrlF toxin-antitoxin module
MTNSGKIIKGTVTIPVELRIKYKMYDYAPIVFIEMDDGIMIKLLGNYNNTKETKKKIDKKNSGQGYPNLDDEIITLVKGL